MLDCCCFFFPNIAMIELVYYCFGFLNIAMFELAFDPPMGDLIDGVIVG